MPIIVSHNPPAWQSYDLSEDSLGEETALAWDSMVRSVVLNWQSQHSKDENSIEARYDLGECIREIYNSPNFIKDELPLLLRNFRLHLGIDSKKRHGQSDYALMYWFKLSEFPRNVILQLKVSQWVDCFDTNSMKDDAFLHWLVAFIDKRPGSVSYETLRIFRTLLNANVAKMSIEHIDVKEKHRIYEATMEAALILTSGSSEFREKEFTNQVRNISLSHRKLLNDVMIGDLKPIDYATQLVSEWNNTGPVQKAEATIEG